MNVQARIERLQKFKEYVAAYAVDPTDSLRSIINQERMWVRKQVANAGCMRELQAIWQGMPTIDVDPFDSIFSPPYGMSIESHIIDMIDATVGVLSDQGQEETQVPARAEGVIRRNFAFIAMPIDPDNRQLDDVLDTIKEAASQLGINAERIDEPQSNERVTDRILASIRTAQYVIVDLTHARPNVYYEAGYAQGRGKTPVFVARKGTEIGFDLKDYPVIFFESMRQLKEELGNRLKGLAQQDLA